MYAIRLQALSANPQNCKFALSSLLAIDLSNQIYKAAAVHSKLTSGNHFTGGLYGFLEALTKGILETRAEQLVICKDVKPYLRTQQYPAYKALRVKTQDDALVIHARETQILVQDLADAIGLPMFGLVGFEADDLIAHIVRTKSVYVPHTRVVAASNDSDLYQLFDYDNFGIWRGKKGFYWKRDYHDEWGLNSNDYIRLLALMGTHNEIEGIAGVGPVTALKLVRNPARLRACLVEHQELVDRNTELIKLPHAKFPLDVDIPENPGIFTSRKLIRFCGRYDITVQGTWIEAFERLR